MARWKSGRFLNAPPELADRIARCFRDDAGRTVAILSRILGDIELAEDALQEAYLIALERWPLDGTPAKPSAWILATARNRAVDRLRRERVGRKKQELIAALETPMRNDDEAVETIPDDRLTLIFACCHPAIAIESRIALTLRTLAGLSTEEIADAFLVPHATMAQRLVRVKRKIRDSAIPLAVPAAAQLPERLQDVCMVLYLIFNEGYAPTNGDRIVKSELCDEAIRLCGVLMMLMPQEPELMGLLALMLYHDSRRDARISVDGTIATLADQDRNLWDHAKITQATSLLRAAARHRNPGPYQLQAGIAAEHALATSPDSVDWNAIVNIYTHLEELMPSPIVSLNRVVAISFARGPADGLEALDALGDDELLESYHLYHVARADALAKLGRGAEAVGAYQAAIHRTQSAVERSYLRAKLERANAAPN